MKISKTAMGTTRTIIAILMTVAAFALAAPVAFADAQGTSLAAQGDASLQTYNEDSLTPRNGIPLVVVRVNESPENGSIEAMNNSYRHSVKCTSATVEIKVPEGYSGGYAPAGEDSVPSGEMQLDYVRGRGNSTWNSSKKPYKLQINGKKDLFGMGASEDWALLANSFDKTLMRNRITFWLGEQMELDYTPQQVPVDLVMIGSDSGVHEYGSYCLCETIKVEDTRIAIDKLKKNDADNVTGGYLMATYSDQGEDIPESTRFITNNGVEFENDTPEYDDTEKALTEAQQAQRAYIRGFMQELENLIMTPGAIDAERHEEIAKRMDLTSLADYWLLQELSFNTDGFATTSTYLYKKRDGKLYWGPLWDFDNAWNNNGLWNDSNRTFNNTAFPWIDALRDKDPRFVTLLQERFQLLDEKLQELTRTGGIIDQYEEETNASQQADYEIWKDTTGDYRGTSEQDFNTAVDDLKSWIDERREWVQANKADIGKAYFTVSYEANGHVVATERVRYGEKAVMDPDAPVQAGHVFECWKNGNKTPNKVVIKQDTVFTAQYMEEDEAVAPASLTIDVPKEMATVELDRGFFPVTDGLGTTLGEFAYVEPYNATNQRIRWTSSDEVVGTIDEVSHRVILKGAGDTTITGTLYNGVSDSFVLHVIGEGPISINNARVILSPITFTYNGIMQKPAIVSIGGRSLAERADYTASWSNPMSTDAGSYAVTITGTGNYAGTTTAKYKIEKAENSLKVKGKTIKVYRDKLKKAAKTLAVKKVISFTKKGQGKKTYTLSSAKKGGKSFKKCFAVGKKTGKVTVKKGLKKGTYKLTVRVRAAGNANYKAASKKVTFKIKVVQRAE